MSTFLVVQLLSSSLHIFPTKQSIYDQFWLSIVFFQVWVMLLIVPSP